MSLSKYREYQCFDSSGQNDKCTERTLYRYLHNHTVKIGMEVRHFSEEFEKVEYSTISGEFGVYDDPYGEIETIIVRAIMKCWGRGLKS